MKTEITDITLKIGEREIKLTADEARAVHKELDKLFKHAATTMEIVTVPLPYPHPIYIPAAPYYAPWWQPTWIYASAGNGFSSASGVCTSGTLQITC